MQLLVLVYFSPIAALTTGVVGFSSSLRVFVQSFPERPGSNIGRVAAIAAASIVTSLILTILAFAIIAGAVWLGRTINHIGYC